MRCPPTLWKSKDFSYEMPDGLQPVIKLRFSYMFSWVFRTPVDTEGTEFCGYFVVKILTILKGIFSISCDLSILNLILYDSKNVPHLCKTSVL